MEKHVRIIDNKLVYRSGEETLVIEPWGRDGLRVRVTPLPETINRPWALTERVDTQAHIETSDTAATIRNGKISARIRDIYTQKGHLEFFKWADKTPIPILREYDYRVHAHNPGTRRFKSVGDGLFECELHFEAQDGERMYGMGENATGRLNLKGCVIDLYQRHVKAVVPFVVSSRGQI